MIPFRMLRGNRRRAKPPEQILLAAGGAQLLVQAPMTIMIGGTESPLLPRDERRGKGEGKTSLEAVHAYFFRESRLVCPLCDGA